MDIYVRKNVKSLNVIGGAIARHLRCGISVQIQYTERERDIIVRFERRLEGLYGGDFIPQDYPPSGWVYISPVAHQVSDTKRDEVKYNFVLVYDDLKSKIDRVGTACSEVIEYMHERYVNKERF